MFDSKSPVIKIGGYIIVGFFVLIIIIMFGMPDFMSRMGMDKSVVAVVNGEKIQYLDFLRYRDNVAARVKDVNSKEMQQYILDSLIRYRLQLQKADEIGIRVSDEKIKRTIREIPMFRDRNGKFSNQQLNYFLDHYHLSLNDYYVMVREELINNEMIQMIRMGVGASPCDVKDLNAVTNSKIQIRYCYVSNTDLKKKLQDKIAVADGEIDNELKKNRSEIKDPKTDRDRIRNKLADQKFEALKKGMINDIDKLSFEGKSFEAASVLLGGKAAVSNVFKIGEPVREASEKGSMLFTISDSPVFINDCLALSPGQTSRVINSFDGLYVYTPVKKEVNLKDPSPADSELLESRLLNDKANALYMAMMVSFMEKSKVSRNLSLDK